MNWRIVCILMVTLTVHCSYAQVTEDFNHGSVATSESNCWLYDDVGITSSNPINSGTDVPQAAADIQDFFYEQSDLTSPFLVFDGSETLTFKHRLDDDWGMSVILSVYIVDANNNVVWSNFNHVYRQFCLCDFTPNGDPTVTNTESISINYTGTGRLVWEWESWFTYPNEAYLDDISVTAALVSPEVEYDTVCEDKLNVLYEPTYSNAGGSYSYTWGFTGASGGPIVTTLTGNDRRAQIDWINGPGDYQLLVQEFYNGVCTGRSTYFNVHVIPLPDIIAVIDTVCEDKSPEVTLSFIGTAPWELKYKIDGGATQTLTTSTNPYTITLPPNTTIFDMINLKDAGECNVTATGLPTLTAFYFPLPLTGPIYH